MAQHPDGSPRFRLTYAVTPPSVTTTAERRRAIAAAQSARISALPIDALLVYDVQDEAARNGAPRPFSFVPKVDPLAYAFDDLAVGALPRVVYRAVANGGAPGLCRFLDALRARGGLAVLVGAPSRRAQSSLPLSDAYSVCRRHAPDVPFGGVVIPERHGASGTEDARVLSKRREGCGFFVSQTVWSVAATKRLLSDLRASSERAGEGVPPLLLTFSPCGSPRTLAFQSWLGVEVPSAVQRDLLAAKDMLARSVELAVEAFAEIRAHARDEGVEIGCNVESVSSRAEELDASTELLHRIHGLERPSTPRELAPGGAPAARPTLASASAR